MRGLARADRPINRPEITRGSSTEGEVFSTVKDTMSRSRQLLSCHASCSAYQTWMALVGCPLEASIS